VNKNAVIGLYCSQATKHKSCLDAIVCTKSDELYQTYLLNVGDVNATTYLCENDTVEGCTDLANVTNSAPFER